LSRRRIHRVSRLLEPRSPAPSRLPRRVRALQEWQAGGRLRDVRGRLLEGGPRGTEAPAGGRGGGAGRIAVCHRRRGRDDLAGDVQRAVGGGRGGWVLGQAAGRQAGDQAGYADRDPQGTTWL